MSVIWTDPQGGVWIGGKQGTVMRWDGATWRFLPIERPEQESVTDVNSIWGTSSDDVWACADTLFHFDGTRWTDAFNLIVPPPPFLRYDSSCRVIAGIARDDAWMGSNTAIYHWDGAHWNGITDFLGRDTTAIAATSPTEAWAIVDVNKLVRWDGKAWAAITWPQASPTFQELWLRGPGDLWVTASSQLWHGDGASFEVVPGVVTGTSLYPQHTFGPRSGPDVYFVDDRIGWEPTPSLRVGTTWTPVPRDGTIHALRGTVSSAGVVWMTGEGGQLWRLDNGRLGFVTPNVTTSLQAAIRGIWSDGNGTVLTSGSTYGRSVGGVWQAVPTASDVTGGSGMYARSATDAWSVGVNAGVFHYDGTSWTRVVTGLSTSQASVNLVAVAGSDSGEIWAVGQGGKALHFDGQSWQLSASAAPQDLAALWMPSADEVWACGKLGAVVRWKRDTGWSLVARPFTTDCRGIWGRSPTEVWAVAGTAVYRYNGQTWDMFNVPAEGQRTYTAIAGLPNGELWTASEFGVVLHWNGTSFERERTDMTATLFTLSVDARGGVWVAGERESVLHRRP